MHCEAPCSKAWASTDPSPVPDDEETAHAKAILTTHGLLLAAVAEKEAEKISTRTLEALATRKACGLPLGNSENLTAQARQKGAQAQLEAAVDATQQAAAFARLLRQRGDSYARVADELNAAYFRTRRGSMWDAKGVLRMRDRIGVA